MARRDLTNFRTVTNVVADVSGVIENVDAPNSLLNAGIDLTTQIIRQGQEAKITENMSNAQLDLNALQSQYQIDFEGDPMGGIEEYRSSRKDIMNSYGEQISPLFRRQWNAGVRQVEERNDVTQQAWGLKQTRVNTVNSVNNSMKNGFTQATIDGRALGAGTMSIAEVMVNYANSRESLTNFAIGNLGEVTGGNAVSTYDEDYMKSILSGAIEEDPVMALEFLDNDAVRDSFSNPEQYSKMKEAAENKVLNFKQRREDMAILNVMTGEDGLYAQSLERDLSVAELEGSYLLNNTPKSVQKVLNRMNGYGVAGDELTDSQKVNNSINLFDSLAALEGNENVTLKDIELFRAKIYENLENGSITSAKGTNAFTQLIAPSINAYEKKLETYSARHEDFIPFNEMGFVKVQSAFKSEFEIDGEDSALSAKQLKKVNDLNKLRLYESYNDALTQHMPEGTSVANIGTLNSKQRNKVLKNAQKQAVDDYAFQSIGYIAKDTDTQQDVVNIIKDSYQQAQRSVAQDTVDNAYKAQSGKLMVDANCNRAMVFPDGTIKEIK